MNKSKILKRSLAVILAMMMIFAMIPLSASAANAPVVHSIDVAGASATGSGTAWEAKLPTSSASAFSVGIVLEGNAGMVYYAGKAVSNENGVFVIGKEGNADNPLLNYANLTDGKLTFQMYDEEGGNATDVTITFTLVNADNDATVKSFTIAGQYGETVIDHAANTITVVVPYSYAGHEVAPDWTPNSANIKEAFSKFESTGDTATKAYITTSAIKNTLTITAQSGASKTYTVIVKAAAGFTAFSVEGERKAADVGATTPKTVEVYMPYGSNATSGDTPAFKFTPSFTTGYPSVTVYGVKKGGNANNSSDLVALTSGEEINLATFADLSEKGGKSIDGTSMTAVLKYTGGVTEEWTIHFNAPTKDPVPEIKSLTVDNFAAEISGKTITLELPAEMRDNFYTAKVMISKGVTVFVNGVEGSLVTGDAEESTPDEVAAIDLTKDTQSMLVTAATGIDGADPATATYSLVIKTKEAEQAKIKAASLQDADGNTYEATINQSTGVISFTGIPFAITTPAGLAGYKFFYTITNGSQVDFDDPTGTPLDADLYYFPAEFNGQTKGREIEVWTGDASRKVYNITVARGDAARGAKLTSFTLTNQAEAAKVTAANSYTTEPTTANALTISIAASKYDAYNASAQPTPGVAYAQAELSDEAALYYVDAANENALVAVDLVEVDDDGTALPTITGYNGEQGTEALTLVVLSQQAQAIMANANRTTWDATSKATIQSNGGNASDFTEYSLSVFKKAVQDGAAIETFEVYNPFLKETIKGTINTSTRAISLTVPYRWTVDTEGGNWVYTELNAVMPLRVNFTSYHDSLVHVGAENGELLQAMEFDADGNWVDRTGTPVWITSDGKLCSGLEIGHDHDEPVPTELTALWAVSESGNDSVNYGFVIKVEEPNTEAELISATIKGASGKPDAKQNVSITLPFGTEITALKTKLVASKNAIILNGEGAYMTDDAFDEFLAEAIYNEDTAYNFTQPKKFTVVSENGKTFVTYTVAVTLGDQFDDVDPNKWYAAEIMEAVARGIAYGYNGKFNPDKPVTRGQFAQFLARADGYDAAEYENVTRFSDVPAGTEQAAAIAYCYDKGYINGYGDTTFKPDKYINRQEVATILAQFKGLSKVAGTPEKPFADDAQIASWAKGWVYAVADAKVMVGKGENFDPLGNTTRAEACAVCVRVTK